jgi:hypothetical protein
MADGLSWRMMTYTDRATEYRKHAAVCLEVAGRMPLEADRVRMTDMAQRWLDLAKEALARAACASPPK